MTYDPVKRKADHLKNREIDNKRQRELIQKLRKQIFDILGQKACQRCGFSDMRALQLDHINGGGTQAITKRFGSNSGMYYHYVRNPNEIKETFQVLCANCNQIKRHEKQEHVYIKWEVC